MENKKRWQKIIPNIRKNINRLNAFIKRKTDEDFFEFDKVEKDSFNIDDTNNLKKLNYLKTIQLSETGYVDNSLKEKIKFYKYRESQIQKNKDIIPIGNLNIAESGRHEKLIKFGYDNETGKYKISTNNIEGVPIWNNISEKKIINQLSSLHPKKANSKRFEFKPTFFDKDILELSESKKASIADNFSSFIQSAYNSNKAFKANQLPNDLFKNPHKYIGKNFIIPNQKNGNDLIVTLRSINNDSVIVRPLLKNYDKNSSIIISKADIENIVSKTNTNLISKINKTYSIGVKSGNLVIGHKKSNNPVGHIWTKYEDFLNLQTIPESDRNNIKSIIATSNFLLENSTVSTLNNDASKIYTFKVHYKTNKIYYSTQNSKSDPEKVNPRFIELTSDRAEKVRKDISNSINGSVLDENNSNTLKKYLSKVENKRTNNITFKKIDTNNKQIILVK